VEEFELNLTKKKKKKKKVVVEEDVSVALDGGT
jgi:hypothetical protein